MRDETKMDAKRLITEVYKRPALWNQRHISYHNRDVTNRQWMEIAALFNLPKQVLKTKWKGLRDTFRAEIKKEEVYRKSNYTPNRPAWIHFKTLQFLKEQMLPRPPIWERSNNSSDNDAISNGASEDSCSGIDASDGVNELALALANPNDRCDVSIDTTATIKTTITKDNCRRASKRICSRFQLKTRNSSPVAPVKIQCRGIDEDACAKIQSLKDDLSPLINSSNQHHSSNHRSNKNKNNNNNNSNNIQDEETSAIKLEPVDHYDDNVEEFGNIAEEMNNVDDNGSMLEDMSNEKVLMNDAVTDNCVIAGQLATDPLEGNRFDDNYYFFMSLLPHIRTLPAERRMLLRMQMQQLVYQEVYDKNRSTLTTALASTLQDQRRSPDRSIFLLPRDS